MTAGTTVLGTGTLRATAAPRVLAVADSDSYLKWAAWTLARLRDDGGQDGGGQDDRGQDDGGQDGGAAPRVSAVLVRSPIAPTPGQASAAVAGTGLAPPPVLGTAAQRRLLRRTRPDVVLVAATGPVAELVARQAAGVRAGRRPALVTGLPGMALPATTHGTGWRRWCDAFVVHAAVEAGPYAEAFAAHGAAPELVLTRLPFLDPAPPVPSAEHGVGIVIDPDNDPHPVFGGKARVGRVVLAAQAKVPASRDDRVALLDGLAKLSRGGLEVVVKLRARAGERQTHNEEHPLDALWAAERARLGHPEGAVRFATGPMSDHLVPGTALLTVSSTAALESLARGLPTIFLTDFGVGPGLLNEPFAGSGCLRRLDEVAATLRAGGPTPDPAWCAEHYLQSAPSQLPAAVAALAARARAGELPGRAVTPWSWPRHTYTVVRSALPVRVARALRR
ncbi:hypothetical protein GCM10009809_03210 [Isoptericola hypogeus]|uniref:Uncharacterized protein n=1 Tax=Isoptericola hypogeus TaxID=300179 RepID=A0ABN2IRE3_9MICO